MRQVHFFDQFDLDLVINYHRDLLAQVNYLGLCEGRVLKTDDDVNYLNH